MFTKFRNYFIAGLVVILPLVITVVIFQFLLIKTNKLILEPIIKIYYPLIYNNPYLIYLAKGVVLILSIVLVASIGLATKVIVVHRIFSTGEKVFFKIPMVGKIYVAIKQISQAFLGEKRGIFRKVILLQYPRPGIYSIGFVTSKSKGEAREKIGKEMFNVFVPTTPNPTSGVFLLVPEEEAILLDISVEDGLKLVISGGVVVPD